MKLMTESLAKEFEKYPLMSQDGMRGKAKVIAKYFNPCGVGTWFITEAEKEENGDYLMFGYCHLGDDECAELGYIRLSELESIHFRRVNLGIERDLFLKKDITLEEAIEQEGLKVPSYLKVELEENLKKYYREDGETLNIKAFGKVFNHVYELALISNEISWFVEKEDFENGTYSKEDYDRFMDDWNTLEEVLHKEMCIQNIGDSYVFFGIFLMHFSTKEELDKIEFDSRLRYHNIDLED